MTPAERALLLALGTEHASRCPDLVCSVCMAFWDLEEDHEARGD